MYTSKLSLSEVINMIKKNPENVLKSINTLCDFIEKKDSAIQAFLPEKNRKERLINDVLELEQKFPDPKCRPLLYGVLIGVKDIFRTDGFPTKAGSKLPEELFAGKEAACVTKLKNAGALILGKTVTTEFAYFEPGPTRNPNNIEHTPGGSSSGSAAAVAAGFCSVALGTQTIGSIIRPASFCGVIGIKPSYGRISTEGVIPFAQSADHIGFFTQDIEGIKIVASVLCDNWKMKNNADSTIKLPVIGVPDGKYLQQANPDVLNSFEEQILLLQSKGVVIKRIPVFDDIEEINTTHRTMCAAEMAIVHKDWFAKHENLYRHHTRQMILTGQQISKNALENAKDGRYRMREKLKNLMNQNKIDLWISPSTTSEPLFGLESTGSPAMNLPWTYAGMPAITIPIAFSKNKLPLGIQFTAKFMEDEKLLLFVEKLTRIL